MVLLIGIGPPSGNECAEVSNTASILTRQPAVWETISFQDGLEIQSDQGASRQRHQGQAPKKGRSKRGSGRSQIQQPGDSALHPHRQPSLKRSLSFRHSPAFLGREHAIGLAATRPGATAHLFRHTCRKSDKVPNAEFCRDLSHKHG